MVVEVGPGVKSVAPGDHVIPLYTPECRECEYCLLGEDQPLPGDPRDPGPGPDARRHAAASRTRGRRSCHYMGSSTFSNYTVLPEIAVAKIRKDAPFDKVCYIGCGVTTGIGAVRQHGEGRAGLHGGGVRPRRHRAQRDPGREDGRRRAHHRRRPEPGEGGARAPLRHDRLREPERGRRTSRRRSSR